MRWRGATRLLLTVAGVALAVVVLLWGATGLALRSNWLLEQVDADPEALFVAFTGPRASLVPGRLRFATLTLRSRDPNIEWEARLEDVTLHVALPALAGRRFHATVVRAAALGFRLRERLEKGEATPARLARYPDIVGFPHPPLRGFPPPRVPPGDPWRVVVDDLRVGLVREIWIDSWRWRGEGRLAGGFRLRPGVEAEVLPSELSVGRGTLAWGKDAVSRETSGAVRASLPRFDTKAYPGNEVWRIIAGSASLQGSLDAAPFLSPEGDGPRFPAGGSVRLKVGVADASGSGLFVARIRDARPLVALVPAGPPKWIAGLVGLRDFEFTAQLHGRPGILAMSPAHAGSGTLAIDADLREGNGRRWGAALVRKGALAAGLELGDGTSLHLLNAEAWFAGEGRPGGLRTDQPRGSGMRDSQ
jgi:hypothetical protein